MQFWLVSFLNPIFYFCFSEGLQIYNVRADNFTQIMSPNKMNFFRPYEVKLSADKRYLLMKKSYHRVFRRSSHGTYDILDLHSGIMTHLKPTNWSKKDDEFQVRYISWAPRDNGLVYVDFDNNVSNFVFTWNCLQGVPHHFLWEWNAANNYALLNQKLREIIWRFYKCKICSEFLFLWIWNILGG